MLDVQALAKEHTVEAIEALVRGLRDPKLYVQAAEALLSRAWGKPVQAVTADATLSVVGLHLIAAQTVSGELGAELATRTTITGQAESIAETPALDLMSPALE